MRSCQKVTALVSKSQDEELGRWETFGLELHIKFCRNCRNYVQNIASIRELMGTYAQMSSKTPAEQSQDGALNDQTNEKSDLDVDGMGEIDLDDKENNL